MTGLASVLFACQLLAANGEPATYEQAYKNLEKSGQPILVLVGADWCPGCVTMKQRIMPRMLAGGRLSKVTYAVVNTDRDRELAGKLMQGGSIPQLILYRKSPTGVWYRDQITGATSEEAVAGMIERGEKAEAEQLAKSASAEKTASAEAGKKGG